jgi:LemA protein
MKTPTKWLLATGLVLLLAVMLLGGSYNALVTLDQAAQAQWGQVESAYQRRADLVPNLVAVVKGAAGFETETLLAVTEARSKVGAVSPGALESVTRDPEAFQRFEQAQGQLSSALSRLLVVAEKYPELKATDAFRDLQVQLEGTENRVTVERMRFNDAARAFNSKRDSFPIVLIVGLFGERFREKPYFHADQGAQAAPKVSF